MEKYGVEKKQYEVVRSKPGYPDDLEVVATGLTLEEANEIKVQTPSSFIRPE